MRCASAHRLHSAARTPFRDADLPPAEAGEPAPSFTSAPCLPVTDGPSDLRGAPCCPLPGRDSERCDTLRLHTRAAFEIRASGTLSGMWALTQAWLDGIMGQQGHLHALSAQD